MSPHDVNDIREMYICAVPIIKQTRYAPLTTPLHRNLVNLELYQRRRAKPPNLTIINDSTYASPGYKWSGCWDGKSKRQVNCTCTAVKKTLTRRYPVNSTFPFTILTNQSSSWGSTAERKATKSLVFALLLHHHHHHYYYWRWCGVAH